MSSLTKRLADEGTRQAIVYGEELVYNMLAITWNALMSMAKNVEDNVLCMMTMQIIAPQPIMPQNPVANPLHASLKVPNALVIK